MLQFIWNGCEMCVVKTGISIHLMLQFIKQAKLDEEKTFEFQYISCCSLSIEILLLILDESEFQYISCCSLSIFSRRHMRRCSEFQYISCCSLSEVHRWENISSMNFNTSHVVVYHHLRRGKRHRNTISIHLMLQFILNSIFLLPYHSDYFNTSHVVVYPLRLLLVLSIQLYFNTSHVVVYRFPFSYLITPYPFQYISCCSLSSLTAVFSVFVVISIHLMLQFIIVQSCTTRNLYLISIHLMLQFILINMHQSRCNGNFNTSHVVVYPMQLPLLPGYHHISIHLMLQFIIKNVLYCS